jgi:ABC-type nitrate/sulfonate/bicarbonate transport system permease component
MSYIPSSNPPIFSSIKSGMGGMGYCWLGILVWEISVEGVKGFGGIKSRIRDRQRYWVECLSSLIDTV